VPEYLQAASENMSAAAARESATVRIPSFAYTFFISLLLLIHSLPDDNAEHAKPQPRRLLHEQLIPGLPSKKEN
jgi:hypothetical protein